MSSKYKKRNYKKKIPGPKLSKKQKVEVKRMIAAPKETKYHGNQAARVLFGNYNAGGTTYGYVQDLTNMPQGNPDTSRIGDEITVKSLEFKVSVTQNAVVGANLYSNFIRCVIIQWHPDSVIANTVASVGQIFAFGPSAAGTADVNALSIYNHDQLTQFTVWYDKLFALGESTLSAAGGQIVLHKMIYPKKHRKTVRFTAGATTGAQHLWLIVMGLNPEITNTYLTYNIRTNYTDA